MVTEKQLRISRMGVFNGAERLLLGFGFVGSTTRIAADERNAVDTICEASCQFALRSSAPIRVVDPTNRQTKVKSVTLVQHAHRTKSAAFRAHPRPSRCH
jgi:hypothetical protein